MTEIHAQRFERVVRNLAGMGLTQMVVSDPPTIFYLTGVRIFHPGERMLALLLRALLREPKKKRKTTRGGIS